MDVTPIKTGYTNFSDTTYSNQVVQSGELPLTIDPQTANTGAFYVLELTSDGSNILLDENFDSCTMPTSNGVLSLSPGKYLLVVAYKNDKASLIVNPIYDVEGSQPVPPPDIELCNLYPNTPDIDVFTTLGFGCFFCFGESTYMDSDSYAVNRDLDPLPASNFTIPAIVDSGAWATEAKNMGAGYAIWTTNHHNGFLGVPDDTSHSLEFHADYHIGSTSGDKNILGKFLDQCEVEGILGGAYYNIGKNINVRGGLDLIDASYDQTGTYSPDYPEYKDFTITRLTNLLTNYPKLKILWLDAPHHFPREYMQEVYNACKSTAPNVLITLNYDCPETPDRQVVAIGNDPTRPPFNFDGTFTLFLGDVYSFESFRLPESVSDLETTTTHKGVNYKIGREIIKSILENQWFSTKDNYNPLRELSVLQTSYDNAKANGVPFLLGFAVNQLGEIPQNQLDRGGELVL